MSENFKSIIRALPTIFDTEDGHKIGKEFNSPCIEGSYKYKRQTGDLTSNYLKILTDECVRDLLKTEKYITTYDIINEKGNFIGGAIAPGIDVSANYLIQKAALLNETTFKFPDKVIGKNTETNLQSGIMYGGLDSIEGMINRIKTETNYKKPYIILTGGFSSLISDRMQTPHKLDETLTLYGLKLIVDNNY